jgi:two-component system chemotaxis response regulator CheB
VRGAPPRDVVCIGAAEGCLLQLARLIAQLPLDFAAAVFVAFRPTAVVQVVDILRRCASLPVAEATNEECIASGRVRVGPRDRQLRLTSSRTKLDDVALEPNVRPSIDVLFGSAASRLGRRVIGVLLGGGEGDGSEGARAIHSCGGLLVVPRAAFASGPCLPPSSACRADYVVPMAEVGALLVRLVAVADPAVYAHPLPP